MNLRTRLVLLIVGAAVIPPLIFGVVLAVAVVSASPEGLAGVRLVRQLTRPGGDSTVQTVLDQLEEVPREVPVHVIDAAGIGRYPQDLSGEPADIDAFVTHAMRGAEWSLSTLRLPDESGGEGRLLLLYPQRLFPMGFSFAGLIVPLGFLLFAAVGSMFIIRSINVSIAKLEGATRRIAEGDLDFKLQAEGRDRLASLTRSFESMRLQLREQFDRGSRFLMGISHDLKTPLSSITGYVDAITDGYADSPEKLEKYTSIIRTKTQLLESRPRQTRPRS